VSPSAWTRTGWSPSAATIWLEVYWRWPNEVLRLLEQGGFEVTDRFGGFDGEPFGAGASDLIFLARPW